MKNLFLTMAIFILSSLIIAAQQPKPTATPPAEDESVVKISTELIQLDVVVTDKNGNLVLGLKPEDFEITENGERQAITGLSYFSDQKNVASGVLGANITGGMPTVGEVRRTVAIVINDSGLSAQSISLVKKELVKFISEQVQPGDLVAIIQTSGSVGILQQFTADKNRLLKFIEDLRYRPATGPGLSPFEPISISFAEQIAVNRGGESLNERSRAVSEQRNSIESIAELNKNLRVTKGSLGVLNSTITAMSQLPGRKSVLYIDEGVTSLFETGVGASVNSLGGTASIFTESRDLEAALRGITEFANRAAIAIYALDPRGALPVNFSAADSMRGGMTDREMTAQGESSGVISNNDSELRKRSDRLKASQLGLKFLAEETGGKAFINTNNLGKSLKETLDSQNGYYVIAYQPSSETFDADKRRFNKLVVKVKRPNVNVSYRSGFFNVAEDMGEKKEETPERVFLKKLFSPYRHTELNLQMTAIYAADEQTSTVRAFIGINPNDLQFVNTADGNKSASFDLIAVTFNESGIPVAAVAREFGIKVSQKQYENLLSEGLAANLAFAAGTKGVQQVKVAVRDRNTQKIGTALQTINIPAFDKNTLSLSGILLQNFTPQEWENQQSGKPDSPGDAANRMQNNTAHRKFKKGTVLSFVYTVYASPSMNTKSQAQFTLFKDGKEIFKGAAEELNITPTGKLQRTNRGGAFMLGTDMSPGKYVLQVAVSGDAIKEPEIRQIDFDLVN